MERLPLTVPSESLSSFFTAAIIHLEEKQRSCCERRSLMSQFLHGRKRFQRGLICSDCWSLQTKKGHFYGSNVVIRMQLEPTNRIQRDFISKSHGDWLAGRYQDAFLPVLHALGTCCLQSSMRNFIILSPCSHSSWKHLIFGKFSNYSPEV